MPQFKPHHYAGGGIARRTFHTEGETVLAGDEFSGDKIAAMPSKHVLIARGFIEVFPT